MNMKLTLTSFLHIYEYLYTNQGHLSRLNLFFFLLAFVKNTLKTYLSSTSSKLPTLFQNLYFKKMAEIRVPLEKQVEYFHFKSM